MNNNKDEDDVPASNNKKSTESLKLINHPALTALLHCTNCKDIPFSLKIFTCESGLHPICSNCVKINSLSHEEAHCSVCNTKFTENRLVPLEHIINGKRFNCLLKTSGCKEVLFGSDIMEHYQNCEYRPMNCYHQDRVITIPYKKIMRHCEDSHGFQFEPPWENPDMPIRHKSLFIRTKFDSVKWPSYYSRFIEFDGRLFVRIEEEDRENLTFYFSVFLLGTKKDASKYSVTLTIAPKTAEIDVNESIVVKVPVHSFRVPYNEVKQSSSQCASIPLSAILRLVDRRQANKDFIAYVGIFEILIEKL